MTYESVGSEGINFRKQIKWLRSNDIVMWLRKRFVFHIGIVFVVCVFLIVVCNIYLLHIHSKAQSQNASIDKRSPVVISKSADRDVELVAPGSLPSLVDEIRKTWEGINWSPKREFNRSHVDFIWGFDPPEINPMKEVDIWAMAREWVSSRQIYPKKAKGLRQVLQTMATAPIVGATVGSGGTQLKLSLTLKGGQKAVFKPMR